MKNLMDSIGFAIRGFRWAASSQSNLRFHLIVAVMVVIGGFFLQVTALDWCILLLCIGLVVSAELFNTAIEKTVDLISPEWNDKAGIIKDIAAAAVLFISLTALIIGIVIFGQYLMPYLISSTNY
jgi:diacylglycerol kinase (ATP)